MLNWVLRWAISAISLAVVAAIFPHDISYRDSIGILIEATVAIGLVNALIRPVLAFFTAPLNCLTLGIFGIVLNGVLFWAVQFIVPGFKVTFGLGAVLAPILMGLVGGVLSYFLPDRKDEGR